MSLNLNECVALFDLPREFDISCVKSRYRSLVKESHPYLNKSPYSQGRFLKINQAYKILKKNLKYEKKITVNITVKSFKDFTRLPADSLKTQNDSDYLNLKSSLPETPKLNKEEMFLRLKYTSNNYLRKALVEELAKSASAESLSILMETLQNTKDEELILLILCVLRKIKPLKCLKYLTKIFHVSSFKIKCEINRTFYAIKQNHFASAPAVKENKNIFQKMFDKLKLDEFKFINGFKNLIYGG